MSRVSKALSRAAEHARSEGADAPAPPPRLAFVSRFGSGRISDRTAHHSHPDQEREVEPSERPVAQPTRGRAALKSSADRTDEKLVISERSVTRVSRPVSRPGRHASGHPGAQQVAWSRQFRARSQNAADHERAAAGRQDPDSCQSGAHVGRIIRPAGVADRCEPPAPCRASVSWGCPTRSD